MARFLIFSLIIPYISRLGEALRRSTVLILSEILIFFVCLPERRPGTHLVKESKFKELIAFSLQSNQPKFMVDIYDETLFTEKNNDAVKTRIPADLYIRMFSVHVWEMGIWESV